MRIPSNQVPQADRLNLVLDIARAVGSGARTYQDLSGVLRYAGRQGRYYRRATELLGLTERRNRNESELTERGREWFEADGARQSEILAESVLSNQLIQRIIPFLEARRSTGCRREELEAFITSIADPVGRTMIPRRTNTVISWLRAIGMLDFDGRLYHLQDLPQSITFIRYASNSEPLLPTRFDLREYQTPESRATQLGGTLTYAVDQASRERAVTAHADLVDLVASRLRLSGAVPRSNNYVDLAANVGGALFFFEMKSATARNIHAQIRAGISQLYEYRWLQASPNARLVLVTESPVPVNLRWMMDYLVVDRAILLLWDGNASLACDPRQHEDLQFVL